MNEITRSPETIATEINSIKLQTRQMVLHNSIEIGKRLAEAKEAVPHGEWGKWLEASVDYSQSTANNLMKIYEEYGDGQSALFGGDANSEAIASLPYTKALALMSIPIYEREEFVEKNNVHDLSTRQLDKLIKENKELEKKLKVYEEEAEEYESLKKQIKTQEEHAKILEEKLEAAEENNDKETIDKLNDEIKQKNKDVKQYKDKIKKIEAELKKKPIDAKEIIEVVPEEVTQELETLRKQVKASTSNEDEVKFKFQFEMLVENFKKLLESLSNVESQETKEKYQNAVKSLIEKMTSKL